ncbi:MAG: class II aldolase/adducin family protein [Sphingomonadales bacterium]|nr:class II aldolase/adducin family protein [Sphingomonadales bacterium]MBU3991971.1 class II aldolase/adducin family protein [Alphaproteobacteria bacterium]
MTDLTVADTASDTAGAVLLERRPGIGEAEWETRVDLAACYRLIALHGWDDLIATHISARVPGTHDFLINRIGLTFEEITASNLVRVDLDGTVTEGSDARINPAGFTIHSAIHAGRGDVGCVIHCHTSDGVAVSAMEEGLLPLNQIAMLACGNIAYHDYEGVAFNLAERERLQRDLGGAGLMMLRNHGTLTVGASVGEAYMRMYTLERACTIQVRTLAMGRPLRAADPGVIAHTGELGRDVASYAASGWPAAVRRAARLSPGFDR